VTIGFRIAQRTNSLGKKGGAKTCTAKKKVRPHRGERLAWVTIGKGTVPLMGKTAAIKKSGGDELGQSGEAGR